jgi:hypothetical protein
MKGNAALIELACMPGHGQIEETARAELRLILPTQRKRPKHQTVFAAFRALLKKGKDMAAKKSSAKKMTSGKNKLTGIKPKAKGKAKEVKVKVGKYT